MMRERARRQMGESCMPSQDKHPCRAKKRMDGGGGDGGGRHHEGIIPLLTAEEERCLARGTEKGEEKAREVMIWSNLRLVKHLAKRYTGRGLAFDDLVEEGNIGLIKAVDRFRVSKGCRFSTYAVYWIQNSIERAIISQAASVRLPLNLRADMDRLGRVSRELEAGLGRPPGIEELASRMNLSGRRVKKLLDVRAKCVPLEVDDDEGPGPIGRLFDESAPPPTELADDTDRKKVLGSLLEALDERERGIIIRRFGLFGREETLKEIGDEQGVSRERIRQVELEALEKVRKRARSLGLDRADIL